MFIFCIFCCVVLLVFFFLFRKCLNSLILFSLCIIVLYICFLWWNCIFMLPDLNVLLPETLAIICSYLLFFLILCTKYQKVLLTFDSKFCFCIFLWLLCFLHMYMFLMIKLYLFVVVLLFFVWVLLLIFCFKICLKVNLFENFIYCIFCIILLLFSALILL